MEKAIIKYILTYICDSIIDKMEEVKLILSKYDDKYNDLIKIRYFNKINEIIETNDISRADLLAIINLIKPENDGQMWLILAPMGLTDGYIMINMLFKYLLDNGLLNIIDFKIHGLKCFKINKNINLFEMIDQKYKIITDGLLPHYKRPSEEDMEIVTNNYIKIKEFLLSYFALRPDAIIDY